MSLNNYPKVSVIILNWNGKDDTLKCLASVKKINYPNFKTIVVDNGSTDGSQEVFRKLHPWAHLIETGENLGYAGGNNVGIRYAIDNGADYVFVLNNDTIVDTNVITALVNEAENNPRAAILGPKIYFYDRPDIINSAGGYIQYDTMKRGHIGYGFKEDNKTYSLVTSVEWTTGAAFLLSVSVLKEVGLFDPDYFLICEELDLCARVRKRGYDILFVPDSKVWHKVSASFEGNYSPVYCYYFFRNSLMYVRKNIEGNRRVVYKQLLRDSWEFYRQLKERNDPDYKNKGLYIFLGIMHFFLGVKGKAPSWTFKLRLFDKKPIKAEETSSGNLFNAEIISGTPYLKVKAGTTIVLPVTVRNLSKEIWPANSQSAVRLSYHLFAEGGEKVVWDGVRTNLPKNLAPGKKAKLKARIKVPEKIGNYILELDMVQEMVTWFSNKGAQTKKISMMIK